MRRYDDIEAPVALHRGHWRRTGLVLRWVDTEPSTTARRRFIACPTCHAATDQLCRTRTGRHRSPHASRLIGKRCSCGEELAFNKKLCDLCRKAARRENGRIGMRNTRARRKAA